MSTKIAWTEETFNPVVGCSEVSPGCLNCYALNWARRLRANGVKHYADVIGPHGQWSGNVGFSEKVLNKLTPRQAPKMIFVCSMGDLFHKDVPFEFIDKVMAVIALCPQHTFQVLTKRADRMAEYIDGLKQDVQHRLEVFGLDAITVDEDWPLKNLWLGVSAENQEWWDKRKEAFFATPAALHFVSFEPLLGGIVLSDEDLKRLGWVIIGAESKGVYPGRRCELKWLNNIKYQCQAADIPAFFKQVPPVFGRKLDKDPEIIRHWGWPQQYPKGAKDE